MNAPAARSVRSATPAVVDDAELPPSHPRSPRRIPRRPRGRIRRRWLEGFIAACALGVSLASWLATKRQGDLMARQLEASVWPYLQLESSNWDPEARSHTIILGVRNVGVGPARVRSMHVTYRGEPVANVGALLRRCCGMASDSTLRTLQVLTSGLSGSVLAVGQGVRYLQVARTPTAGAIWSALDRERFRVEVRVCYCSVLDRCWIARKGTDSTQAVPDCDAEQRLTQFAG